MSYSQIEYMGTYEGYQHSYYMYSIPTPGSNFFFKILPNNSVSLKQVSDEGTIVYYTGFYKTTVSENITSIECKLHDRNRTSNTTYTIEIDTNTLHCVCISNSSFEPDFDLVNVQALARKRNRLEASITAKLKEMMFFFNNKDTAKVIDLYEQISVQEELDEFNKLYPFVKEKILFFKENELIRKEIKLNNMIQSYSDLGDSLFSIKYFDAAFLAYEHIAIEVSDHVLIIGQGNDLTDSIQKLRRKMLDKALIKMREINKIREILKKRKNLVFSYKENKPKEYSLLKGQITQKLNNIIANSMEGKFNINYQIAFDTSGNNLSSYSITENSAPIIINYLDSIKNSAITKPSTLDDYYVSSIEKLEYNAKWSTSNIVFKSSSKGIKYNRFENQAFLIKGYISNLPNKYGYYKFAIKNVDVNNSTYSNIYLVNSKKNGPESALLSMVMPGLGSLKVSYGEIGWGRLVGFIFSSGIALGMKKYSQNQYGNFLAANNKEDMENYYGKANFGHKMALIAGGVSVSIYIYDVFWVLFKGSKNLRDNNKLLKRLKDGPIQILNQPLSW